MSLTAAKADLDAIGARLRREYPGTNAKKLGVNLFRLDQEIVGDARALLLTLLGAVVLLLLVACANIANLLLVAMVARRRELSLRAALGATRWRIVRQLLFESACLSASVDWEGCCWAEGWRACSCGGAAPRCRDSTTSA